ncbi:hypothetical protein B0H63DRAFT_197823 [Podospora didyma]|uniref:Alcohol dehydrogenase-like N-terminal domain-containing protein n=1 Tax=Podospora didyma TaxID=330526 RepID=A0AAE0NGU2_9PEZI|nr:hypothetical protein B0H63DRAFT_197823 [Podospora didyma]
MANESSSSSGDSPKTTNSSTTKSSTTPSTRGGHIIVVDVGATTLRFGIFLSSTDSGVLLPDSITRRPSPSKLTHPTATLASLQDKLISTICSEVTAITSNHPDIFFSEIGIALGAVVTRSGVIQDASILWGSPAKGYDFAAALHDRLPFTITVLNDVSAAAWRYKHLNRFCLITVSSGLGNKVFNSALQALDRLDLDDDGVGGEMGHVVVEPRAVDAAVVHAVQQAVVACPDEFSSSKLREHVKRGDPKNTTARDLGRAALENDAFTLKLLDEADLPVCACGNLADLCAYGSGRAALKRARTLAARDPDGVVYGGVAVDDITDTWLQEGIATNHPLAMQVLDDATYPLGVRILQLAADIGLDKFVIVGGFALRTAGKDGAYLAALQDHLLRLYHRSAFFADWDADRIRGLVRLGADDDNDGLIGMGYFIQHQRGYYRAVVKPIGETNMVLTTRKIPRCGAWEVLTKVVYAGLCTTDLQILRGERGHEPVVLGHEGVLQVLEVGRDVRGVVVGDMVVLNPNNPLDDHDKLGHSREGLFQEYVKFGRESIEREQVLVLGREALPSATDTLIEPLSCVVAAQERIKGRIPGKNVLVVGAGFMGLLFVSLNVKMGAKSVFLANRSRERLDFAVSRGIVDSDKAFTMNASAGDSSSAALIERVTKGEGVDIVIICVSLGQGLPATQDAIQYINPEGGCVYLFAGFRPGDMIALDGGKQLDGWGIRTGWKTETIHTAAGKALDISGHRGSRQEDLAAAARLIRGDSLAFGRVLSHVISLDALPETMLSLVRDGKVNGVSAQRVVVDMSAPRGKLVERADDLPLRHLKEAARKSKRAISSGNLYRELGFDDGGSSMLGWVVPPAWSDVQLALEGSLDDGKNRVSLASKRHIICVGTGSWGFLVDALREMMPSSQSVTFHTCQSLNPRALAELLERIDDLSAAVCLGISQSGTTLETVALMGALRERFDSAGLSYPQHFAWLTDVGSEAVVRASRGGHDWQHVSLVPLTANSAADINALFCAPHSMVMFLPLFLMLDGDMEALRGIYQQYLTLRENVVRDSDVLSKACFVASNGIQDITVDLPGTITGPLTRLITQLVEQALGSKQADFNPRVQVRAATVTSGLAVEHDDSESVFALQLPTDTPAVVEAMLTMDALSIFVAAIAYHRRIQFVTHPKVNLYKRRAVELLAATATPNAVSHQIPTSDPSSVLRDEVTPYIKSNPHIRSVELICYSHLSDHDQVNGWLLTSGLSCPSPSLFGSDRNISVEVYQGEEWNHSRYQAAVDREDTVHVVAVADQFCRSVEGISDETVAENLRLLEAIARATYETLLPRAFYLRIGGGGLVEETKEN